MALSYLMSFTLGMITLIVIYIFNWFQFRSNLNFIVGKIFGCCCPCCKRKEFEVTKEEGDGKNLSERILEKYGLLIRTHPYGKSGIQGLEKLKFVKINKQRFPDFSSFYNNNYNTINLYQYQTMLNEQDKKDEKIVNQILEFEGNNKFKNITNQFPEIPNEGNDKSILFKLAQ